MKKLAAAVFAASMALVAGQALAASYTVYCANGKIEIDTRNLKQMNSARGGHTYAIASFNNRTDAEKLAKKMGGVGCKCAKK